MTGAWNIKTRRPDPDGGPDLHGRILVCVRDAETAVALVQSKMPDATVLVDSEALPRAVEDYDMMPGEVLLLVEGK